MTTMASILIGIFLVTLGPLAARFGHDSRPAHDRFA